jgi:regulatory protein YycI of two-component signal transduction system YycFG
MKNKKNIIVLVIILIILFLIVFFIKKENVDKNNIVLPENYSLDNYNIEKITDISCKKSIECKTPPEYLVRSNCPYTSMCINKKCNVICPVYKR